MPQPGEIIGGCTIEARIAEGGMGVVFRARKELLAKTVAVKVLHADFVAQREHLARFMREARLAASLDHPSIVKVHDVGEDSGRYYMVMEYIKGRDLRSMVTMDGPLSPRKALRIARQVVEAVSYAHERGLVHRDIKPANILLAPGGEAKLVDFGIARPVDQDTALTMAGTILGTPAYMSPEQCRGERLDGRSDLYSLGATLYMLLSGKSPFPGEMDARLLHRVIHEKPPSLGALAPQLPDKVVVLVQRLMAKHRGARYQTGRELIAAIDEIVTGRFVIARQQATQRPTLLPATGTSWRRLAFLLLLGSVLGVGAYLLNQYLGEPEARSASATGSPAVSTGGSAGEERNRGGVRRPASPRTPGRFGRPRALVDGTPRAHGGSFTSGSSQAEFGILQDRVLELLQALLAGEVDEALSYVVPWREGDRRLRSALEKVDETLALLRANSATQSTTQTTPGEATTVITFRRRQGGRSAKLSIHWLFHDGTWFVEKVDRPVVKQDRRAAQRR